MATVLPTITEVVRVSIKMDHAEADMVPETDPDTRARVLKMAPDMAPAQTVMEPDQKARTEMRGRVKIDEESIWYQGEG